MVRDFYFDKVLFVSFLILVIAGIIFVYSATSVPLAMEGKDSLKYLKKEILFLIIGSIVMITAYLTPIYFWKKIAYPSVFISFVLLIIVLLFPANLNATHVKRWLDLGLLTFQPSEFAKFSVVLFTAMYISKKDEKFLKKFEASLALFIVVGILSVLVLIEPHKGGALYLVLLLLMIMFSSNFKIKHLIILMIPGLFIFIFKILTSNYAKNRIIGLLDPEGHRTDVGLQAFQSILSFAKGGILGEGIGTGTQKLKYLPEIHTDYIYALIGEETGFIGALVIIGVFLVILFRGISISLQKEDKFVQVLGVGLTYLIVMQALFHIMVNLNIMPSTGFTLPFVSYGGSSLIMNMAYAGILLRISKEPNKFKLNKG